MSNKTIDDFSAVVTPATTDTLIVTQSNVAKKETLAQIDTLLSATTKTLTNKTLTSPVINTAMSGTAIDTDGSLTANSDTKVASQKAVKTYADLRMLKTGSNLAIGSDADGDMYYRASSVLARLAKGAANLRMFMNAGATAPEWASGIYVGSLTRDLTAASGNVAYTGVGFKPSLLIAVASFASYGMSVGFDNVTAKGSGFAYGTTPTYGPSSSSIIIPDGTNQQTAVVASFDADGFTLTWTKTASPTGTATVYYIAIR